MPKPKATKKKNSARGALVESLMRLREEARQRMTPEEFEEADRRVHELADRVRARHKQIKGRPSGRPLKKR